MLTALLRYIACIIDDGDYRNDWLTHLPATLQPLIIALGHLLAILIGS